MGFLFRLVRGAVAGAVAGAVLKKVDELIRGQQDSRSSADEGELSKALKPEARAVEHLNEVFSLDLNEEQREQAAHVMKFGLLALFSTVTRAIRSRTLGRSGPLLGGALFGVGSYLLINQIIQPLLGIAKSPFDKDSKDHLRELLSHAVSGIADNATRQMLMG